MKIKKAHLSFVTIGKDRIYLRYFVTSNGKPLALNISADQTLSKADLHKLNAGELGGMIQKGCDALKEKYRHIAEVLNTRNDSYPTPEELKNYFDVTEKEVMLRYLINKFILSLNCKASTKKNYQYALSQFQQYYESILKTQTLQQIISKNTILNFEGYLIYTKYVKKQDYENNDEDVPTKKYTLISLHNTKAIAIRFLNFIAELYGIKQIEMQLKMPNHSGKWHITPEDLERLLAYTPETLIEADVLDIITFNKNIGLRITEVLQIQKQNILVLPDCIEIRFLEAKKSKERTIIVVAPEGIAVIKKHLLLPELWQIKNHVGFDYQLKRIAKVVFKDESIKIYKVNTDSSDYVEVKKADAISSHCFRRFAISRNIATYGIDVARSYSGHSDYQIMVRSYTEFMKKEDLKKLLLKH